MELPARVRPDLLGLVFTFKMLYASSQGEGWPAAGCSVLWWALSPAPGLRLGRRWDSYRMLLSPWLLTRTAPAGRALPASSLLLAAFLVLYFDSKSKAASPLLPVWLGCPVCRGIPGVHPRAALPLAMKSRPFPHISLMELERQAASVPGEEGQLGLQCSLSSALCRY